jgi:hypothetical protein
MTETETSWCDQKNGHFLFEHNNMNISDINDSGDGSNNNLVLALREERATLLKNGLRGNEIESLYLSINGIVVIGVNWQDLNHNNIKP